MGLQKNELIAKLEQIAAAFKETLAITKEIKDFQPEDNYERTVKVPQFPGSYSSEEEREVWRDEFNHSDEDAIETIAYVYERTAKPKEPVKPASGNLPTNQQTQFNETKQKFGCLPIAAGFLAVCILLGGGLFAGDGLTIALNLILLAACAVAFLFFYQKKKAAKAADEEATKAAIAAFQKEQKEQAEKYARDTKAYQDALATYEKAKATFLQDYTKWREIYLAHLAEEEKIEEQLEAERVAGQKRIYAEEYAPAKKRLEDCNDLLTEEYLPAVDVLVDLLKSGRADDLKEAINLLEDIRYRERQLELQREQEQQRQREEALRRQDEERHHREQMQFQEQQEYQRRAEERQRQRDEERRHQEDMKQREQQERNRQQEEKARLDEQRRKNNMDARAAEASKQKRCMYCAYQSSCGVKHTDGAYNCTGFRPK